MKKFLAYLSIICFISLAHSMKRQCSKPHTKFEICGTACPPTCADPNPQICTEQCVMGCFCESGYVLDDNENCILQSECPTNTVCPANMEYNECGTACPLTCADPNPGLCTTQCVRGCFCNPGYVLDFSGTCVLENECPNSSICPHDHMEYTTCGSACPPTCGEPIATFCTLQCIEGCFCESGYFIHNNGSCVLEDQC